MLRLADSLAGGTPVSLRDTLSGIDHRNIELVITAVLHAWGQRPEPEILDHFLSSEKTSWTRSGWPG